MIPLASFLLAASLLLVWRGITGPERNSKRILRLIFASWCFFSSFFFLVEKLSLARYISIAREPWQASLSSEIKEIALVSGDKTSVPISVENSGTETFNSTVRDNPVFLSFHVLDSEGRTVLYDNTRFAFSGPLQPNQQQTVVAVFDDGILKLAPGRYIAEFDLVRERLFWFQQRGSGTLWMPLIVEGVPK